MKFLRLFFVSSLLAGLFNFIAFVPQASAAAGDIDSYITLNGSTQYGQATDVAALKTFNAISIEFWAKPTGACSGNIVAKLNAYAIYCSGGTFYYALAGSSAWLGITTTLTMPNDEWHHYAITRAASTDSVKVYFDGVVVYTGTADGANTGLIASNTNLFGVGIRSLGGTYYGGAIDEVRISNVERTEIEINQDMNMWGIGSEVGVVAYYDFNDSSGTTVANKIPSPASGTGLTITGSPNYSDLKSSDTSTYPGYSLIKFPRSYLTSNGGWVSPPNVNSIEAMVVAGGGGGGFGNNGGGGGAGGVLATNSAISISPSTSYSIIVGQGGLGSPHAVSGGLPYRYGYDGDTSTAFGAVAVGGGGGGGNGRTTGNPGGSGGGAAYPSSNQSGGTSVGSIPNSNWTFYGNTAANSNGAPSGGAGAGSAFSGSATKNGGTGVTFFGLNVAGGGAAWTSGATPDVSPVDYGGGYSPLGANYTCPSRCDALVNTGSGGGSGGDGAAGIVVIKYKNYFGTSVTISVGAKKTTKSAGASAITATTTSTGTVTFYANGRIINGCKNVVVSGTTATCNWRPMTHGQVTLTATYTSNDPLYSGSAAAPAFITTVGKRTTAR